jgi:hypothetical protein
LRCTQGWKSRGVQAKLIARRCCVADAAATKKEGGARSANPYREVATAVRLGAVSTLTVAVFMGQLPVWKQVAEALERTFPKPLPQKRCELLPRILDEWGRTDLRRHLSRESREIIRERIKRLKRVKARACRLSDALSEIDKLDQRTILVQMIIAEGRRLENVSRTEFSDRQAPRGHPRNIAAYQVLQDAAAIFEWLTDARATRAVDRIKAIETGPFFRFASILWPVVFKKGVAGLSAAIKNWAAARSKYNERSALIANIAMRYPTWGVFDG